jgi:hypothetical protein
LVASWSVSLSTLASSLDISDINLIHWWQLGQSDPGKKDTVSTSKPCTSRRTAL